MLFKKKKGQGALEYLLLIGGAVLIAVIVVALLIGMGRRQEGDLDTQSTPEVLGVQGISCDTTDGWTVSARWRNIVGADDYLITIYDTLGGSQAADAAIAGPSGVATGDIPGDVCSGNFVITVTANMADGPDITSGASQTFQFPQ